MRNMIVFSVLVIVLAAFLGGCCCGKCQQGNQSGAACESCEKCKANGTGWCDSCDQGVVNGQKVGCKGCYVAKTGGPACSTCAR